MSPSPQAQRLLYAQMVEKWQMRIPPITASTSLEKAQTVHGIDYRIQITNAVPVNRCETCNLPHIHQARMRFQRVDVIFSRDRTVAASAWETVSEKEFICPDMPLLSDIWEQWYRGEDPGQIVTEFLL